MMHSSATTTLPHPYNKIGDGPEGPEVRCVADCLRSRIVGWMLNSCNIQSPGRCIGLSQMNNETKYIITDIITHGKKLFFFLNGGEVVIMFSLGMTGRLQFQQGVHSNVWLELFQAPHMKEKKITVFFDDSRRMGHVDVLTQEQFQHQLVALGPDLLHWEEVDAEQWRNIFRGSNRKVCDLLTDQSLVAGVGWYIMTDALYLAGVKPTRKGKSIGDEEWERIRVATYQIIRSSYDEGGYTIRDYITPTGERGGYQSYIYDRDVDYLHRPVIMEKHGGRTLRYVEEVQQ